MGLELLQYLSLCPKDFSFLIYQIEGELGCAVFQLFLTISFFTVTVHPSSQMSCWLVTCGKEEQEEEEILLRIKKSGLCLVLESGSEV